MAISELKINQKRPRVAGGVCKAKTTLKTRSIACDKVIEHAGNRDNDQHPGNNAAKYKEQPAPIREFESDLGTCRYLNAASQAFDHAARRRHPLQSPREMRFERVQVVFLGEDGPGVIHRLTQQGIESIPQCQVRS